MIITNTLAYYETAIIMKVKSFLVLVAVAMGLAGLEPLTMR
jgi:hypothetical protein